MLLSMTAAGRVFIWAHILKENWEVFAPGFRSLEKNVEYIESETEFDLNPDPAKIVVEPSYDDEQVRISASFSAGVSVSSPGKLFIFGF